MGEEIGEWRAGLRGGRRERGKKGRIVGEMVKIRWIKFKPSINNSVTILVYFNQQIHSKLKR